MQGTRIVIDHPGGPEVLRAESYETGAPGPGEALVRHEAVGLNFIDTHHRNGRYPLPSYPSPLGLEAAGIVIEVGPGVTEVAAGDRVAYSSLKVGAYSDVRVVAADRLIPVPAALDLQTAAAALNKGLTAHFLCHTTHAVQKGETILVHAAAGGVGSILCQWANHLGATVIGTVGRAEKAAFARGNGCTRVIVTENEDFVAVVREMTGGRGVPVVYDAIGPATLDGSLRCLAKWGLLVSFGTASGPLPPLDLFRLNSLGSLFVTSPGFADHTTDRSEYLYRGTALFQAIADRTLQVPVGQSFPLAEAARAHEALQSRLTTGSSVLIP
jgi:NADPH2:quinone reductase